MTANIIHLTVAAHQAELHRAANGKRHQAGHRDGNSLRLAHAALRRLRAGLARPARRVAAPRIAY